MKKLRPGYCVRLGADYNELKRHSSITHPNGHVFTDDLKSAWDFKQAFPHIEVAHRNRDAEKLIPLGQNPADWLVDRLAEFDALSIPHDAIVIHTANEPNITPEVVEWECAFARAVLALDGVKPRALLLNPSVGKPDHTRISEIHELLAICVANPDQFYLGSHGYAPTLWTVGINGTVPPDWNIRQRKLGQPNGTEAAIKVEAWPESITNNACWYLGRWRFIANYCHLTFKALPRIWESECGFDDVEDAAWWQQTLPKDPQKPDKRIGGWKTNEAAWQKLWPTWSVQQALWEQTKALIEVAYEADFVADDGTVYESPVAVVTLFGFSPMDWADYDYSRAYSFKSAYETHIAEQNIVPTTKPITKPIPAYVPKPENASHAIKVKALIGRNLRSGPDSTYNDSSAQDPDIRKNDEITLYNVPLVKDSAQRSWHWCDVLTGACAGKSGWICATDFKFERITPPTAEVPVVKPDPDPVVVLPPPPPETMPPVPTPAPDAAPAFKAYQYDMRFSVTADDEEAADALAKWLVQTLSTHYQQLRHDAAVMEKLRHIESAQFNVEFTI